MTKAVTFLESLQRFDLAMLLGAARASLVDVEVDQGFFEEVVRQARIVAPTPIGEALKALPEHDRKRIAQAIATDDPRSAVPADITVEAADAPDGTGAPALLAELIIHREMMISVATGGDRIQEVDDYYRAREVRIRQTLPAAIPYDNPHPDLWSWFRQWKAEMPQFTDRRPIFGSSSVRSSMLSPDARR